jgi:hypothetical protein
MRQLSMNQEGGGDALFHLSPAVPAAQMLSNMRSAIARGLPEATICRPHPTMMSIAGGGPSLADTYQQMEGWVCAVNGSLQWLIDRGLRDGVSYACGVCDANDHIADVVPAHRDVRYYIASVCSPRLFDKLIAAGCDVRLWHVTPNSTEDAEGVEALLSAEYDEWSAIGGGCTMGLRWIELGYFLGFRRFSLHGMDSSFRDKATHAYPDHQDAKDVIEFDGYRTRVNFLAQVHDFADLLENWWGRDNHIEIKVFGEGLLQNEWKQFREANPAAFKGDIYGNRVNAVLTRLPEGPVVGAEIGVFGGRMSRCLLERPGMHLYMVDQWLPWTVDATCPGDIMNTLTMEHQEMFKASAIAQTDFAANRRTILHMDSVKAADHVPDGSLDFVFIDANHSYEGCKHDIEAWLPKLKDHGLLCGHDYSEKFPGVIQAVNEFAGVIDLEYETDVDSTWFFQL